MRSRLAHCFTHTEIALLIQKQGLNIDVFCVIYTATEDKIHPVNKYLQYLLIETQELQRVKWCDI